MMIRFVDDGSRPSPTLPVTPENARNSIGKCSSNSFSWVVSVTSVSADQYDLTYQIPLREAVLWVCVGKNTHVSGGNGLSQSGEVVNLKGETSSCQKIRHLQVRDRSPCLSMFFSMFILTFHLELSHFGHSNQPSGFFSVVSWTKFAGVCDFRKQLEAYTCLSVSYFKMAVSGNQPLRSTWFPQICFDLKMMTNRFFWGVVKICHLYVICHNHGYPDLSNPDLSKSHRKVAIKLHIIYMPFHLCFFRWRSGVFKQINFNHGSYICIYLVTLQLHGSPSGLTASS